MALASIQLCHIDRIVGHGGWQYFTVTVHDPDGGIVAVFKCDHEGDAVKLRNAIREHADQLLRVADYNR